MLKLLFVLFFATFVFFITLTEGSSYSTAWATSTAGSNGYHPPPPVPNHVCCENEIYSNCSNIGCGPKTCDQLGYKIGCVKMDLKYCIGGCICKDGYLRDRNGDCIPKSMCPACGGDPNAVSCDNEDTCKCRDGFIYDEIIGKCVVPEDCHPKCGINERYEKCPQLLCIPQKCSQLGFPWPAVPCPAPNGGPCPGKPGCVCIDGYVRNDIGKCIPKKNCPSCGGDPHALPGCGLNCGRLCSNYDKGPVPCPKICLPNACDCRKGYVFDENLKKCVKPKDCTPSCCVNEVYDTCANGGCRKWNCSQTTLCIDPLKCVAGCVCRDKYTRADNGTCIPEDQCVKCNKPHEIYDSCPPNCPPQTCESIGKKHDCLLQPLVCRGACRCEPGYYRDKNGDCIHEKHCQPQCPVGEVYEKCPDNLCTPQTCSQLGFPIPCPSGSKCLGKPRCICANGNVRDSNGKCIPKDWCPSCGGDTNATPGCGVNCGRKCSDYKDKNPVCHLICHVNGCDCKKGYVYDEICKKCVLPSECTQTCGVNEVYDTCANGGCRKWKCSLPKFCKNPVKCEGGCVCRDKYTRAENGICIPEDQCEPLCPVGEVYEKCPDNLCTPQTCSQLGFPVPCPSGSKCLGKPRCICANGNVRDSNGKCIPKDQCPSCGGDTNATPGCGVNCGRKCSDYKDKNPVCLLICHVNGCDCKKGYVYDEICKKCVLPSECTQTCGVNEVYDTCANGGCRKWKCSQPKFCKNPVKCEGGCVCRDKYTRAENGICIPEDQCEPLCPVGEVYEKCPDNLCTPQTCSQLGFPVPCPSGSKCLGKPRCICANGNVRDSHGKCIPKDQCPSCGGDTNATPGCGVNCGRKCSDYKDKNPVCPLICHVNGCDCKKGYVYDEICKKCVLPSECTQTCGVNEVYDTCANGGCRKWKCSLPKFCKNPMKCEGGCVCRDKYTRAENGICIPEDQCEPLCPVGEVYEKCPDNLCTPQTCSQLGFPVPCPSGSKCLGKPRCICANGNVRDSNGKCIPKDQCPSCGGDTNATPGCGVNCGRKCSDYKVKNPVCPLICNVNGCDCKKGYVYDEICKKCVLPSECTPTCGLNEEYETCANGGCRRWTCSQSKICINPIRCEAGCSCKDGYTRNKNGVCIPENQCPGLCNKPHEYYDHCPQTCFPQTCENIGKAYACPAELKTSKCKGRCMCEKGYYRNLIGECISEEDCKKCRGPHEYFSCGGVCDNVCATLHKYNQTNCPFINIACNRKCYCERGYARDKNNICIPIHKCPERKCGPNERYEECPDALCSPQKCSQLGFPIDCKTSTSLATPNSACPGKPGCVCDNGYVRDKNGKCIPPEKCPSCGGDANAVTGCGNHCGRRCSDHKDKNTVCLPYCVPNGCSCRVGFVYDDNLKKCVRPTQCTPTCGINEVYDTCANGGCRRWNCSKSILCIDPLKCKAGCSCKKGFSRDKNGICIPEDKCPGLCNKPHEYYDHCPQTCFLQTCENIGKVYSCPAKPETSKCKGRCMCEKGYWRNLIGECISEEDCKKCRGPHEYFSCGGVCDNVCSTLHKYNQTNCPFINITCNRKCYCERGYARDKNNICIPIHKCPERQCGPNEIYEECPDALCFPQKCSQLGFPIDCKTSKLLATPYSSCPGKPSCICDNGYVRDKNGKCIPPEKCPSCGGDPNAVTGCGNHCGRRCSDYKDKNTVCPLYCVLNGCMCRDGFVYDDNLKKCVRPKQCTPTCGINEVYDTCANGGCRRWHCSKSILCIDPVKCEAGCSCKKGFSRDKNGICIPEDKCPEPKCGPNERYEQCPDRLCSPQKCSQLGFPIDCKTSILPATPNSFCPGKPGCVCDNDYVRDQNGKCIPPEECPSCGGDSNAVKGCGINCGRLCSNYNKGPVNCIKICKVNSCDCKHGFVLDENTGKCVIPKDCTPICGKNEVYSDCINGRCERKYCYQLGKPVPCVKLDAEKCVKGCLCKEKYLRADNGACIPEDQCKKRCTKPHEYYETCARSCPPQTCASIGRRYHCPFQRKPCRGACRCEKGYYRNKIGECITAKDCKKCTGPHEYFSCGKECDNVCATLHKQNQTHCPIINKTCKRKCYCEKGYARNDKNICIPIKQCQVPVCGKNEKYEDNPSVLCGPLKCSDLGRPLDDTSVKIPHHNYKPACICKEGYLRDDHGLCVPKCQCKPVCGKNERYEDNPAILCGPLKCSDLGRPLDDTSVKTPHHNYKPACICKEGYLRDDHGLCVPKSQCPPCD